MTGYPLQVLSFIVVFVLIWDLLDIVQLLDLQNDLVRLLVDLLLPLDLNFLIFQGPCSDPGKPYLSSLKVYTL